MPHVGVAAARSGAGVPTPVNELADTLHAALERHGTLIISAFIALFFVASVVTAVRLPLWLDEIYSLFMVNQPSVVDLIRASYAGCDAQAPLFSTLAHFLHRVVPNDALALRLPSIAGFCTMAACVFHLVRTRLGVAYALLATLISVCSLLYYDTEARCYGLVLGFTALTLLFWRQASQTIPRRRALAGLVLSASFAVASQYYCVFFLATLLGAELVVSALSRRTDLKLWVAIIAPVGVILPHYPLIRAARPFFAHFWSPASVHSATSFYDTFFAQHTWVLVFAVFLYAVAQFAPDPRPVDQSGLPVREWIAYAMLSIAPILVVAFVLFTVKIYVSRYTIWAVPAISICVAAGLHRASRASRLAPLCGVLAFAMLLGMLELENIHNKPQLKTGETTRVQLQALPPSNVPIFIANHQVYLENWYYGSPQLRKRLYYAVDPKMDMQYGWPDTGPAVFQALRHWAPIQAPDLSQFLSDHSHFLMAADGRDWLPAYLLSLHYQLTPLRTDHTAGLESLSVLYDASRP